jgi:hypothetical protein
MDSMIGTADEFRGTYNVSDYRWFNLRDGDSTSPNFQTRYGLLNDDYSEKKGFGEYARIVRERGGGTGPPPELARLRLRCRRVRVTGNWIHHVVFSVDGRRVRRDSKAPFGALLPKGKKVAAATTFRSGRTTIIRKRAKRC